MKNEIIADHILKYLYQNKDKYVSLESLKDELNLIGNLVLIEVARKLKNFNYVEESGNNIFKITPKGNDLIEKGKSIDIPLMFVN
jgi:predicted transcriptional regulator